MVETKEINALFTLIDDPDEYIYTTVSDRIVHFGRGIIPNLENLWENTPSEIVQQRIELLIHRLHFTDLLVEFNDWKNSEYQDLLFGALLVAKYQYPDMHSTPVLQDLEKIRRNVWLELNSYLTSLEQANVLSSILFNYYNLKGSEISYEHPDEFFLQKVIESKKGNSVTNAIIYQVLCSQLDIHAKIINIPKQMIIAYFHADYDPAKYKGHPQDKIHFYVDALSGQAYSHQDIENYFKRISVPPTPSYYKPLSNTRIIQLLLEETAKCFTTSANEYKKFELQQMADMLDG